MKNTVLYAVYEYDRSFFIEAFCVNKDRPQMKCNGHCKLAQMQQEKERQKADDVLKQLPSEITYFFPVKTLSASNDLCTEVLLIISPLYRNNLHAIRFTSRQEKPPEIARV